MLLDKTSLRKWARKNGWEPGEPGMLDTMVHDLTWKCETCSERYTEESDMEADDDGIPTGSCEACAGGFCPPESTWFAIARSVVG